MRNLILSGVAALALAAVPAIAQDSGADTDTNAAADANAAPSTGAVTMSADQKATFDAWPADRQSAYNGWTPEYQTYFWSLTPEQQEGYFVLTPTQRSQIAAMTPAQRTIAWQSITRQLASSATSSDTTLAARTADEVPAPVQTADAANAAATPAAPSVAATGAGAVVTSVPGNLTPPPESALNKKYPVCRGAVQDECQTPGEGGAPGRSRALKYWPGKPASEGGH
jgi:hypothetical protein